MRDLKSLYPIIIAWLEANRPGTAYTKDDLELALAWEAKIFDKKLQDRHLKWMVDLGFLRYEPGPRGGTFFKGDREE